MSNINKPKIGRYIQQPEGWKSFTPYGFPPKGGFDITPRLYKKHEEAIRLVGKLDGIMRLLPDKDFFLQMFVNKDAALSSQIEGTKATLQDAIAAPVTEERSQLPSDVDDILHYVRASNYGLKRSREISISLRLVREIHEKMTGEEIKKIRLIEQQEKEEKGPSPYPIVLPQQKAWDEGLRESDIPLWKEREVQRISTGEVFYGLVAFDPQKSVPAKLLARRLGCIPEEVPVRVLSLYLA